MAVRGAALQQRAPMVPSESRSFQPRTRGEAGPVSRAQVRSYGVLIDEAKALDNVDGVNLAECDHLGKRAQNPFAQGEGEVPTPDLARLPYPNTTVENLPGALQSACARLSGLAHVPVAKEDAARLVDVAKMVAVVRGTLSEHNIVFNGMMQEGMIG